MTSQYIQPLTLQTKARVATAIHCMLSEYPSRKKATVMFSQHEYGGTFCPSPIIRRNYARIGSTQSLLPLLSLDSLCSITFHSQFRLFWGSSTGTAMAYSLLSR
jgi:hypothetical protein